METLFSYSTSVTIGYVYSIFVEKNARLVEVCAYSFTNSVKSWLATRFHWSLITKLTNTTSLEQAMRRQHSNNAYTSKHYTSLHFSYKSLQNIEITPKKPFELHCFTQNTMIASHFLIWTQNNWRAVLVFFLFKKGTFKKAYMLYLWIMH